MIQPRHDLATAPLDGLPHRGVPSAGEGRRILVEREEPRTGLVQELRQHLLGETLAHEKRHAPLLEVATQATEAVEQEARARFPYARAGDEPWIQHEDGQPLRRLAPRAR